MNRHFITFEGGDGAGKTTVLKQVFERLQQTEAGQVLLTREPGGNRISEQIRSVILDRQNGVMDARTEALLYAAARRQHLVETVIPALQKQQLVLCDRYLDSSLAYQGGGRQIGMDEVAKMNQFAIDHLMPGLTIYFDVPVAVGLERIAKHRADYKIDRLDVEAQSFHQRVHQAYQQILAANPDRVVSVDASQPVEQVFKQVWTILHDYLNGSD